MKLKYDFHIHSCLSPCGDKDMTPQNIVNMAKLMGYDAIALTDHNTSGNCESLIKVGEKIGLTVLPGMELSTSEEVHIICLFEALENAIEFSRYIYSTMPPIKNKPQIFGEQILMDENDNILGTESKLLITASSVSCNNVKSLVSEYGGISFPAHIDRSSFSIISNLGAIDETFGFSTAEIFDLDKEEPLKEKFPYLSNMKIISNSDAHYLENMRPSELCRAIEVERNKPKDILNFFREK